MIYGVGIDITEVNRIKNLLENKSFLNRFFGKDELLELNSKNNCPMSVAGAFCVKEAFGKSIGIGVTGFSFTDVETLHNADGKPYLKLSNNALSIAKEKNLSFHISISHENEYATAIVIAECIGG